MNIQGHQNWQSHPTLTTALRAQEVDIQLIHYDAEVETHFPEVNMQDPSPADSPVQVA
jgi:hypothetical protein